MKIQTNSEVSQEEISYLLEGYSFLPFRTYGLDTERLRTFFAKRVFEKVNQKDTGRIVFRDDHERLLCLLTYSELAWDSDHFGKPMASINNIIASEGTLCTQETRVKAIAEALLELERKGMVHVSAKVDVFDIATVHALEMNGFRLMDTTVTYGFDFRKSDLPVIENQCVLRLATAEDEEKLAKIANVSFSTSRVSMDRFHADPDLAKEKSDSLYVSWTRNSFKNKAADAIIVAEIGGVPVGYTTIEYFKAKSDSVGVNIGALILSAVSPEARGKGIYTSLIREGLVCLKPKVDIAELGTQITNFPVQKAWSSLGFKLASGSYAFHKSFNC
jgi:ribosomal protein S18 acetylase RimI-like enzyme